MYAATWQHKWQDDNKWHIGGNKYHIYVSRTILGQLVQPPAILLQLWDVRIALKYYRKHVRIIDIILPAYTMLTWAILPIIKKVHKYKIINYDFKKYE